MRRGGPGRAGELGQLITDVRRIVICAVLVLALAAPAAADWYTDGVWREPGYWHYATQPRYQAEAYESSFADMERRAETGKEYPPPEVFRIRAAGLEDAETQLEAAMRYAPHTVAIEFDRRADAVSFYERYRDWRTEGTGIDAVIGAVWTRTEELIYTARTGNSVIITIPRYADGWLACVDTSPVIRIYRDEAYSRALLEFRRTWVDGISGTDAEIADKLQKFISGYAEYDRAENERMQANGFQVVDEDTHSVRGFVERRKAVCDGYTAALQFALACHEIKSFEVILWSAGGNHSVCAVQVDGTWTTIDLTSASGEYSRLKWIKEIYDG